MDEQQANDDTTSDTEHMKPTPGPWEIDRSPAWEDQITSGDYTVATVHYGMAGKARANARLIAAAGTAASEMQEDLSAIDLLKELPKIIRAADKAVDSTRFRNEDGRAHPPDRSHMVDLRNALNAVRKDTTLTDE